MELFNSISEMADKVGWQPDTLLFAVGFFLAVYWLISIIGWGLVTAVWIKIFGWFRQWLSDRRKK